MARQSACLDDGGVNDGPKLLGSERVVMVNEAALAIDPGVLQRMNAFGQADLGHHEGGADLLHFGGGLDLALGEDVAAGGLHADLEIAKLPGEAERELVGNLDTLDAVGGQQVPDGLGQAGLLRAVLPEALLNPRERYDAAMRRRLAGAVDFQIAQHDGRAAIGAQVDERVGHEHAHGVEHVGVVLRVGDHQQVVAAHAAKSFGGRTASD